MKRCLFALLVLSVAALAQNGGPFVSITSPADGASFNAPANITISASASDTAGNITSVDFFNGNTFIGRAVSAPYSITWSNVAAGNYSLTAVASDDVGLNATSLQVNITVNGAADQPPTVSITSPANGATFTAPATISVSANASDSDGTVAQVQFFANGGLIGTVTAAPYNFNWSNVAAGSYSLTAKATDNAGLVTTSSAISITVNGGPNYAGYVDHMGCDSIAGWAADRNRLNTSINVEIYDGSTLIQTVFANVSRPDVGTYLGDNGLHGYSIATPARFKDGVAHQVHVKFETSATELGNSPASLTCTGTGVIQGYKIASNGAVFNSPGATITIDGSQSFGPTVNPYTPTVSAGSHTVTSSTPAGFSVSYSVCNNCTDHSAAGGHPFVAGTSVTVNVTSGGYVDLWWMYTATDVPPTASITSPASGSTFTAPASIAIQATAADSDGTVTKVDFLANGGLIGTVTTAPYNFTWSNVSAGTYSLTARATDNASLTGTSSPVSITVQSPDLPPTASITSPANGASFTAPATINIQATASDSDGTVTKVDFLANGGLIGTVTTAPYNFTWSNVAAGTYTLTARATDNAGLTGTSNAVTVNVGAAPVDFSTPRVDPSNRIGFPGEDLLSGNYNWSLPVVSLKGRAGLDLGLALAYNSLIWTKSGSSIEFDADRGFPGPGFRLGFPTIEPKFFDSIVGVNAYLLIMPTGARVEVRQVGTSNIYESGDSSYVQVVDNGSAGLLARTSGGIQLTYQLVAGEYRCTQMEDRNGNFISVNYNSFGHISSVVDTLDRTITFNYDASLLNLLQSITQTWNGAQHTWASFTYGTVTLQTNFTALTLVGVQNGQSLTVPTQVTLADGSYFTFQYTSWGQVFKITRFAADNHELSHVSYDLPTTASVSQTDCPRFTQRSDFAENWNGGAEAITSFVFDPVNLTGGQMTTPDGTQYKESYGTSTWQRGLTIQSQVVSGGVAKRTTAISYTQDSITLSYKLNPRPIETNTIDDAGNHRRVTTGYNTFPLPSGVNCSLPSDVSEYAADASTVIRKTHTDYNLGTAYLNARILGLAATVSVFDGNNVLASQVGYQYDAGVQNQGTAVQHDETNFGAGFIVGRGNLTSIQRFNALNTSQFLQSSIAYNTVGDAITATDPAGHLVTISYADSFSLGTPSGLTLAYPTSSTDADGFVSSTQYHYDTGAVTLTQDPKGAQQIYTYDSVGRISQQTYHDSINGVDGTNTTYSYPPSLNQIQTGKLLDPGLVATSTQFLDGAGRVYQTMHNFPGSTGGFSTEKSLFDVMGRPAQHSNQTETDGNGTPAGDDATTGFLFSVQQYDWAGRPTVSTNPDGSATSTSYIGCGCAGGLVTTATDEVGRQTRTTYDIFDRPIKVEVLNFNGTVYRTTTNVFDALDHLTSISEQQGTAGASVITTRTYDGYGRLASGRRPEQAPSASTVYTYYPDSTIQSITDGRGAIKNYIYNGRRQPTRITFTKPDGHTSPLELDFSYDSAGNRTQMIDNAGTVTYGYDTWSRLLQETRSFSDINGGATPFPLSYTYNLAGQLTSVTSPFGSTAGYIYDSSGQITTVTGSGFQHITQFASGIQYRAWGELKHVNYGNGRVLDLTYDSKFQVSGSNLSLNAATVMGYNYTYNADGSVHYAQDVVSRPFDRAYQYDQVNRITDAFSGNEARQFTVLSTPNGPYYEHTAYDEWDDLLQRSARNWSVNAATFNASYANLLDTNWTYDNEGNVTLEQENQISFSYDVADEPVTIVEPNVVIGRTTGVTINQLFDGDEQLVAQGKVAGSNSFASHFVRSSVLGGRIVSEVSSSGLENKTYIYQGSSEIAWSFPGSGIEWVHHSLTGSSYQTADKTGSLLQQVEFDPVGGRLALSDPGPIVLDTDRFDRVFPRVANIGDTAGGCIVDWVPVSCDYAQKILSLGWGAIYNGPSVVWDPKTGSPLFPKAPNSGPDNQGTIELDTISGTTVANYNGVTRTGTRINPSDPRVTQTQDPNGAVHINVNDIHYSDAVQEVVSLVLDPSGGGFIGGGQKVKKNPDRERPVPDGCSPDAYTGARLADLPPGCFAAMARRALKMQGPKGQRQTEGYLGCMRRNALPVINNRDAALGAWGAGAAAVVGGATAAPFLAPGAAAAAGGGSAAGGILLGIKGPWDFLREYNKEFDEKVAECHKEWPLADYDKADDQLFEEYADRFRPFGGVP